MLGTFLVNSVPALMLFDSGATHSFVSLAFCELLGRDVESLDYLLIVDVAEGRTVAISHVYWDCILEFSGVKFGIDLIPIAMKELCVIIGMDWMQAVEAKIDCLHKRVRVRTPSGGKLRIQGDTKGRSPALCSAARARRYLQHCGTGFLAYVRDTREVERARTVDDVPIVRDFADVFPEELPGIPPERQVEFRIDLVPSAAPVAKAPY